MLKPREMFEICHELYERLQPVKAKIGSINPESSVKVHAVGLKGDGHMRILEYLADFELAGRRALAHKPNQLKVFSLYHCRLIPYKRAVKQLRLKESSFDWQVDVIKREVGKELVRTGIFPPNAYFNERSRSEQEVSE